MKNINIGITICLKSEDHSVWTNGIIQNAINFAHTLIYSNNNYNVFVVNVKDKILIPITNKLGWDIEKYKTVQFDDIKNDLDILFVLGSQIRNNDAYYLKNKGCKIIHYNCGNHYLIDMENILFKDGKGIYPYEDYIDEVWLIPQMENTNFYYFEILNRKKVRVIPFVWTSMFIDKLKPLIKNNGHYISSNETKRISCFEPNIGVMKYAMYDILMVEKLYRKRPDLIKHFYITNSVHLKEKEKFVSIMKQLDIVNNGIATFESRYNTPYFLSNYTDIVVAHQWENALNYAYLDAIYLGYPLVHNAHLCKECGYYYEGFNMEQAETQLLYAIEHHDKNIDAYEYNTKKTLEKFSAENIKSIEIYDDLIDNLFKKTK